MNLYEIFYKEYQKLQKTVVKGFPKAPARVAQLYSQNSVSLHQTSPTAWHFKVKSSKFSTNGLVYDVFVNFSDLEKKIKFAVKDAKYYGKGGSVNIQTLSRELFPILDLKFSCSCIAFSAWAFHYITTTWGSNYGPPEGRAPTVRNTGQYGITCKHLQCVLDLMPMYLGSFAGHLSHYYGDYLKSFKYNKGSEPKQEPKETPKDEPTKESVDIEDDKCLIYSMV